MWLPTECKQWFHYPEASDPNPEYVTGLSSSGIVGEKRQSLQLLWIAKRVLSQGMIFCPYYHTKFSVNNLYGSILNFYSWDKWPHRWLFVLNSLLICPFPCHQHPFLFSYLGSQFICLIHTFLWASFNCNLWYENLFLAWLINLLTFPSCLFWELHFCFGQFQRLL